MNEFDSKNYIRREREVFVSNYEHRLKREGVIKKQSYPDLHLPPVSPSSNETIQLYNDAQRFINESRVK